MWNVLVLRPDLWTAITMELALITVTTMKTLVSDVKASNCALPVNLTVVCRNIKKTSLTDMLPQQCLHTHTSGFAIILGAFIGVVIVTITLPLKLIKY